MVITTVFGTVSHVLGKFLTYKRISLCENEWVQWFI